MFDIFNIFSYKNNIDLNTETPPIQNSTQDVQNSSTGNQNSSIVEKTLLYVSSLFYTPTTPQTIEKNNFTVCNLPAEELHIPFNVNQGEDKRPASSSKAVDSNPNKKTSSKPKHQKSTKKKAKKNITRARKQKVNLPSQPDLQPMQNLEFKPPLSQKEKSKLAAKPNPLGRKSGRVQPSARLTKKAIQPPKGLKEENWALNVLNHKKGEKLPVIKLNTNSGSHVLVQLSNEMVENLKGFRKAGDRHHISLNELDEFIKARGMAALHKAKKSPGENIEMMVKVSLPGVNEEQILIFIFKKEPQSKQNMVKLVTGYQALLNRIARDRGVSETVMDHHLKGLKKIEIVNELEYINRS